MDDKFFEYLAVTGELDAFLGLEENSDDESDDLDDVEEIEEDDYDK